MKCPNCGTNHPLKKSGSRCSCSYVFTFTTASEMTDGRWTALIRQSSADDNYFFTENQLFFSFARLAKNQTLKWPLWVGGLFLFLGAISALGGGQGYWFGLLSLAAFYTALYRWKRSPVDRGTFNGLLNRWNPARITKLIKKNALSKPPPQWQEDDIHDYGVEKVLICDQNHLVDFLVLNGFHAEQRALIISKSGYPSYLKPHLAKALSENPALPVYVIHDTSLEGQFMAVDVRSSDLGIPSANKIIDLGLDLNDASQIKRFKELVPSTWEEAISIDFLHPRVLLGSLGAAMSYDVPIAAPLGVERYQSSDMNTGSNSDGDIYITSYEWEGHYG